MSEIASRVLRNALDIEAYANGVGSRLYDPLQKALLDIKKRLEFLPDTSFTRTHLEQTQRLLENALEGTRLERERLLMEATGEVTSSTYGSVARSLSQEVLETVHGFQASLPVEMVDKIVSGPLGGHKIATWTKRLDAEVLSKARQEMVNAIVSGDSVETAAKRLRDVAGLARQESRVLARTVFADASDRAEAQVYADNEDVITGFKYLATLDSRTCLICAPWDGEEADDREDLPSTPQHPQCRCRRVALTKYSQAGKRPAVTAEEWKTVNHKDGTTSRKRVQLEAKQVSGNLTFEQFFERQPEDWQRSYLGGGRFELYKSGGLEIGDLVNQRGRVLTLDELRKNLEN